MKCLAITELATLDLGCFLKNLKKPLQHLFSKTPPETVKFDTFPLFLPEHHHTSFWALQRNAETRTKNYFQKWSARDALRILGFRDTLLLSTSEWVNLRSIILIDIIELRLL